MAEHTRGVTSRRTTLTTQAGEMPVHLLAPAGTDLRGEAPIPRPGVVLVQEIFGVSRYVLQRAEDLAALGYVVAVPELYWRIGVSATAEDGEEMLAEGMAAADRISFEEAIDDTAACVRWLSARPEVSGDVGLLGFCFGGGVAFAVAARTPVAALVSYYGSALPQLLDLAPALTVASLHHWGDADAYIPPDVQEKVRAAVVHSEEQEWHTYPGAGHAFDNPHPAFHDAPASALAWERTTAFLASRLPLT